MVHPREVFKETYLLNASSIICIHNHPFDNIKASDDDIIITRQLVEVGKLLEVKIVDHIIIGKNSYFSF